MANQGKTIRKASTLETITIGKLLTDHGHVVNGHYFYDEGWNDQRVAAEAGTPGKPPLSTQSAAYVRVEAFGDLPRPVAPKSVDNRLARLETLVEHLYTTLGADRP